MNLPAVLDLLAQSSEIKFIVVELDPSRKLPDPPPETAAIGTAYLTRQGYSCRS